MRKAPVKRAGKTLLVLILFAVSAFTFYTLGNRDGLQAKVQETAAGVRTGLAVAAGNAAETPALWTTVSVNGISVTASREPEATGTAFPVTETASSVTAAPTPKKAPAKPVQVTAAPTPKKAPAKPVQVTAAPTAKASDPIIVYITATGECYHRTDHCGRTKTAYAVTLEDAKRLGYRPCGNCHPPK